MVSPVLRDKFHFPMHFMDNVFNSWYPGHMAKGLRAIRALINHCDCVIEVHDARAYSRNIEEFGKTVMTSNCKRNHDPSISKIVPTMLDMIKNNEICDPDVDETSEEKTKASYKILVCGIPNTGKSSLINVLRRIYLRRGKATPVGQMPGVTRSIMNKVLIHEDPKIYILDTPGCFPDHLIGEDVIADYLLYALNQFKQNEYVQMYGLPGPCDDFDVVSCFIARKTGFWRGNQPDYHETSLHFIRQFRKGRLGKIFFGPHDNVKKLTPKT
eukprot:gene8241-9123_t